jgi:OOP family OmpA-OmpF porin
MIKRICLVLMVAVMLGGCGFSFDTIRFAHTGKEIQADPCEVFIMEEPAPVVAAVIAKATKVKILDPVLFDFDKAVIRVDQRPILDRIAFLMDEFPDTIIVLEGYASKEGPKNHNLKLSQRRADAVEAALIELGVEKERIKNVVGKGATTQFGDALEMNRRVMVLSID